MKVEKRIKVKYQFWRILCNIFTCAKYTDTKNIDENKPIITIAKTRQSKKYESFKLIVALTGILSKILNITFVKAQK
jgi:hypothetical protein